MGKKPCVLCLAFLFFLSGRNGDAAVRFDELDKPPEGAHQGQMLLGAFISFGKPRGDMIKAENEFLENTVHTFDNGTTKLVEVTHYSIGLGVVFEYMPVNHIGIRSRFRNSLIVQKTNFGSEYENWRGTLYRGYSMNLGPSIHATVRKSWDFVLIPSIGYDYGTYSATPIASRIVDGYDGSTKQKVRGITYGAELNFTAYFSGGLFISVGGEWIRNMLTLKSEYDLTNPGTGKRYYEGKKSGTIDSYCFVLTSGYAFSN